MEIGYCKCCGHKMDFPPELAGRVVECPRCKTMTPMPGKPATPKTEHPYICNRCGTAGYPTTVTPGSFGIELILWLAFVIPGLIYSVWRLTNRRKACPVCGGTMIPTYTPEGRRLVGRHAFASSG